MSVEERVIEIVSEQMGVAKDQVTRETHFVNDLGADSLDTLRQTHGHYFSDGEPRVTLPELAAT